MSTAQTQTLADEQQIEDAVTALLDAFPPRQTKAEIFLGEQYDRGLAWVHFPVGAGGLGLSPKHQKIVSERLSAAGSPNPYARNPIGYGMCGPTVVEWGTPEQCRKYLRP